LACSPNRFSKIVISASFSVGSDWNFDIRFAT